MRPIDPNDVAAVLERVREQVAAEDYRPSIHARVEMASEAISTEDVIEAIAGGRVLENYPTFYKGPCCLIYGDTAAGRPLHVVCSTTISPLVIITVYVPQPPKWVSPTQRS